MSLSAPQPLDVHHRLEEFDCGKSALTNWLRPLQKPAEIRPP